MSTTPRPLIPTGSPPWPAIPSVNTNTSSWSTSMNTVVSGWDRLTPSPCASWISRPISTPSCPEVSGNRLSRRRARTAKVPEVPLVSAIAAAEIASGVFATRSGRHTRAMPGTSRIRSAIWPTACAQAASPRRSPSATRSRMTPSRWRRSTGTPRSRDRGADVAVQDAFELLPVPPLEHDLTQLEQHARLIGALRSAGSGERRHSPSVPAENPYPERMAVLLPGFPGASRSRETGASPSVFCAARPHSLST